MRFLLLSVLVVFLVGIMVSQSDAQEYDHGEDYSSMPVVTVPDDITVMAMWDDSGYKTGTVTWEVTATDNVGLAPGPAHIHAPSPSCYGYNGVKTTFIGTVVPIKLPFQFVVGTHEIFCAAWDAAGNMGHSIFSVTVVEPTDSTLPSINVPSDITAPPATNANVCNTTYCGNKVTWEVTDIIKGKTFDPYQDLWHDVNIVSEPTCFSHSENYRKDNVFSAIFPVGVTTVTCTVTDVAGKTAEESFTVTVEQDERIAPMVVDAYFPILGQDLSGEWSASRSSGNTLKDVSHLSSDIYIQGLEKNYSTRDTPQLFTKISVAIFEVTADKSGLPKNVHATNIYDMNLQKAKSGNAKALGYTTISFIPSVCDSVYWTDPMGYYGNAKVLCTTGNYFYVVSAKGTQSGITSFAANFANIIYEKLGGVSASPPETQAQSETVTLEPPVAQTATTQVTQSEVVKTEPVSQTVEPISQTVKSVPQTEEGERSAAFQLGYAMGPFVVIGILVIIIIIVIVLIKRRKKTPKPAKQEPSPIAPKSVKKKKALFCVNCGNKLLLKDKFCTKCGNPQS